jgi:hypothetical protein
MYNTNASTIARNWILADGYNTEGDFCIAQSNAKGGDPSAAGTCRLYIAAAGDASVTGRLGMLQSTPASSSDTCTAGQIWTDAGYIYVCTATNTIKRAAISSF